jgi:RAD51-like protein 1
LDQALLGGVRVGTITELVGRAGVGKTQLGLQLCIAAAHYKRGSIYIDTEQKLSVVRLQEMTRERWFQRATTATNTTHTNNGGGGESTRTGSRNHVVVMEDCLESVQRVLENVSVHQPQSSSELLEVLSNVDEEISLAMQNLAPATNNNDHGRGSPTSGTSIKYPIQLMILDSIAAPLQREFTSGTAAQRASTLLQMAQILKRIAQEWNIAIVVINQVGSTQIDDSNLDSEGNSTKIDGRNGGKDGVFSTAALGTAWHHCVSTRLLLEHAQDPHRVDSINDQVRQQYEIENEAQGLERGKVRTATIVKSNVVAKHVIEFQVNKMGITGTLP